MRLKNKCLKFLVRIIPKQWISLINKNIFAINRHFPIFDKEYYSCPWIEGGLVFGIRSLHICCITPSGGGFAKISDYNGGDIPFDQVLTKRDEMRLQNQTTERYPTCVGCALLEKKKWGKKNRVSILNTNHYTLCNISCNYCFITKIRAGTYSNNSQEYKDLVLHAGFKYPYLVSESIQNLLDKSLLQPNGTLYWGGGEPTMLRDFTEIIQLTSKIRMQNVVNTNAVIFNDTLHKAAIRQEATLQISLDAGTPETYKLIKGRDYFATVVENIKKYRDGLPDEKRLILKYIFLEENCNDTDIENFCKLCSDMKISRCTFDVCQHSSDEQVKFHIPWIKKALIIAQKANLNPLVAACGVDAHSSLFLTDQEIAPFVHIE